MKEIATEYIDKYKLNLDQAIVLRQVVNWFDNSKSNNNPIVLVHGVFGSVLYFFFLVNSTKSKEKFLPFAIGKKLFVGCTIAIFERDFGEMQRH